MPSSVSQSDRRCACGRPAVTTVCCFPCANDDGHSRFCNEVVSKGLVDLPTTAYRPGAVSDSAPDDLSVMSEAEARIHDEHDRVTAAASETAPCACNPNGPCLEHEPEEPNTDHVVLDYQTSKLCCGQHGSCQAKTSKESP